MLSVAYMCMMDVTFVDAIGGSIAGTEVTRKQL